MLPPGETTGTLYFLYHDHLGSLSAVTDLSGSVLARQWYHPYGAVRASVGALPTRRTYTGQLSDETGLYFYNARYYDSRLGRFISPDPLVPEPGNPQALNRYAYVYNNPLRHTDPSGHFVDAVLDVAFIAYGIYDIAAHGYTHEKGVSLLLDVAGLAIPGATGLGMAARVATRADDVADAVKGVNALGNAVQAFNNADNVEGGARILYHGTNSPAANAIRSNGIDLSVQRANLDFNPSGQKGFYVTNDYEQAVEWAHNRARTRGGEPEVVAFAVPVRELQSLNGKVFSGADPEWASFVTSGRRGTLSHNFDYVEGPMLANPGRGVPAPKGHQLAIFF